MNIAFVSSEVFPFSKTGGLADVSGALPKALTQNGLKVAVFSPLYKTINRDNLQVVNNLDVGFNGNIINTNIYKTVEEQTEFYFIENDEYYDRDYLYGIGANDYKDNVLRFGFFSKAVMEALKILDYKVDIIHSNDWQSALVSVYLKLFYKESFQNTKTVFTVHNLGYQGVFDKSYISNLGLPWDIFSLDGLEFYDKLNFLKGGIVFTDALTTVSKTYSKEIQTPDYGFGLDGLLKKFSYKLSGIVNGIDIEVWNPKTDKLINYNFDYSNIDIKKKNKKSLQNALGLREIDIPLFGIVSRLAAQKGIDILSQSIRDLLKSGVNAQFVLLGNGEKNIEDELLNLSKTYPQNISLNLKFDEPLAHKIYASSDFFVMPSKYEPCGLGQMIAYRYGTLPIVRATGGLKDTVKNYSPKSKNSTGFVFEKYDANELSKTINKAVKLYSQKSELERLIKNVMQLDYSWKNQSQEYIKLYKKIHG